MSLRLFCAAMLLLVATGAAHANVPALVSVGSSVAAEASGAASGASATGPELKVTQFLRRRRWKLQFAAVAELLPWGVVVVDARLRILCASRRAAPFFEAGAGLISRNGSLCTQRASLDRSLRELVSRALSSNAGRPQESNVIGIPDKEGRLRYALRVVAFDDDLSDDAVAVIAISDLYSHSAICRDAVGKLFCLSDREAEFAELFAIGCSLQEIASHMHVAVNTARVHLRNVFHKAGCSSQVELARKFAALP
jgi:DNA-binding CsgD family transcriptional regulator